MQITKDYSCRPVSFPEVPNVRSHPLWKNFSYSLEQLVGYFLVILQDEVAEQSAVRYIGTQERTRSSLGTQSSSKGGKGEGNAQTENAGSSTLHTKNGTAFFVQLLQT